MTLQWKINAPLTVFTALFLALFLALGNWQLQRAEQKRAAITALESSGDSAPVELSQLNDAPMYARVTALGRFDNAHSFLLDNRISQGRFGYEIITPFQARGVDKAVLVNRGWIEGDPSRLQRPVIAPIEGDVKISGTVYRDTARIHFVATTSESVWPQLIQNLQIDALQTQLGAELIPFVIRLDENSPGAYRAEWPMFNIGFGPERHIAYAVTWFAMALTLTMMWLLLSSNLWQLIRSKRTDD
jgi:cytochrome oxidase assembly protein ShyY1